MATYNILKILEKAGFILILSLSLHQTNLLYFTLKDEESVMFQVDTFFAEQITNILEPSFLTIDIISRNTWTIYSTRNAKLCTLNNIIGVRLIFIIQNILKINSDLGLLDIFMLSRVMNQFREFVKTHSLSTLSEHEK